MSLTKEDRKRLGGYCKKLLDYIHRTNFRLIPYETLVSIAGARGPARIHELAQDGWIAGYEAIRRKGANCYDYQPFPKPKAKAEQLSIFSEPRRLSPWEER